jgi:hypothetical protein
MLALLGFSLGGGSSRSARASSAGVATTALSVAASAGVVVAVVVLLLRRKNEAGPPDAVQDAPPPLAKTSAGVAPAAPEPAVFEEPASSLTEDLLWSGLLTQRGDLGLQVALLAGSPGAIDQLTDEVTRGEGPALAALAQASGVRPALVRLLWREALAERGPPGDQEQAMALLTAFMVRLTPHVRVDETVLGDYVWALLAELEAGEAPGPTQLWTARWLGVPPEAVRAAVTVAFEGLPPGSEERRRLRVERLAGEHVAQFAQAVERHHRGEVEARVAELVRQTGPWLPAHLVPEVRAQ